MPVKLILPEKHCLHCGVKLVLKISRDILRKNFCSRLCAGKHYNTFPDYSNGMPEEIKQKMRKPKTLTSAFLCAQKERGEKRKGVFRTGKWLRCLYCNNLFHSPDCRVYHGRRYCSNVCKQLASRKEDKQKTDKALLLQWRNNVLRKDRYQCVDCSCTRKRLLQAHHKLSRRSYFESVYDIENGETLCVYCHAKKHPKVENFVLASSGLVLSKTNKKEEVSNVTTCWI